MDKICDLNFGHIDSKSDDVLLNCFYDPSDIVNQIIKRKKTFLVGRKGTGKTACFKFIASHQDYDKFCVSLNFKKFPFHDFYSLKNSSVNRSSQYSDAWRFFILVEIAKQILSNEGIRNKDALKGFFDSLFKDRKPSLFKVVQKSISRDFKLNLNNFLEVGQSATAIHAEKELIELIYNTNVIIEKLIFDVIDNNTYIFMFDELDEDYSFNNNDNYFNALTSLFRTAYDINSLSRQYNKYIYVLVALRSEIYYQLKDDDLNKYFNDIQWLEWTKPALEKVVSKRIAHSITGDMDKDHWNYIFDKDVRFDNGRGENSKRFIIERTLLRPRDVIQYAICCQDEATKRDRNARKIQSDDIKLAEKQFSKWLRNELKSEIQKIVPTYDDIMEMFVKMGKTYFTKEDFLKVYRKSKVKDTHTPEFILSLLFKFSFLGQVERENDNPKPRYFFSAKTDDITDYFFDIDKEMCVNKGFRKSLRIMRRRNGSANWKGRDANRKSREDN